MPLFRTALRAAGVLVLAGALTGCDGSLFAPTNGPPVTAPPAKAAPEGGIVPPSPESDAMRAYYTQISAALLDQGLLRQDVAPRDAPFSARQLVDNFVRIALYDEYTAHGGNIIARESVSHLRRWEKPVRMAVEFGASIPEAQRAKDRASISAYAGQLAGATRHSVRLASPANFTVLVLNENERRAIGPRLAQLVPGIDATAIRAITNLSPATFCVVFAFSEGNAPTYSRAVAVIRGEHPDVLRLSCLHEELAQGLGLANDSPRARPSIFNDDEEFALLTRHDELLLRILYDRRLTPGMTEAEARPIVETIAAELLGGDS
ncbi:DUF2927 domain-containing protein [Phaeovulum sp.]|uniref:DUF2927 domain-containing protein n=1 Tax=Phaeovulum sp. TaxID=2934796 RepID=UPI0039E65F9E